jgi:hypothetical protein
MNTEAQIAELRTCDDCGKADLTVLVVTCGSKLCRRCWTDTTRIPEVHQPEAPALDRLLAEADARSGGAE